jgi:general secretion pathway protein D
VGVLSEQLATLGKREGLGEIVTLPGGLTNNNASTGQPGSAFQQNRRQIGDFQNQPGGANQRESTDGGPMFVLDPDGRGFMYFGTTEQHERVAQLAKDFAEFATYSVPIFEFYKLKHAKALDLATVVNSLISNQVPSGSLLGSSQRDRGSLRERRRSDAGVNDQFGGRSVRGDRQPLSGLNQPTFGAATGAGSGPVNPLATELGDIRASEDVFVLADEANNQIVVKAPKQLQPQFAKLIRNLDLRRPQVYIDCKISFNTNFGLGALPTPTGTTGNTGGFLAPKLVATALPGLTAAIIRSDQVPIIINAIATNTDARIVSTPQLLVDDNFAAEISSINRVPTSVASQSNGSTINSVGPDAEAGTTLTVTPHISEGGYLNLEYQIELSSFTGPATSSGGITLPPPSIRNNLASDSVTLPSDSTIVIGGLTFENINSSVFKIPFLGDIPLIGQLFRDDRQESQRTTLYVFITPRVMRDPSFADLRLLTEGPAKVLKEGERTDIPPTEPARIEIRPIFPPGAATSDHR